MILVPALALVFLSTFAFASHGIVHQHRCTSSSSSGDTHGSTDGNNGGWLQKHSGTASFTQYSGCQAPACGIPTSGYTAALSQLSFGAFSGDGPGDACGRCFKITSTHNPYSAYSGPFNSIVVRVDNLCPIEGNEVWCGQTTSHPVNQFNASMHFDLCQDSGTGTKFFPPGIEAMTGTFEEVPCQGNWVGGESEALWNGACMANDTTALWPGKGCLNHGSPP